MNAKKRIIGWSMLFFPVVFFIAGIVCFFLQVPPDPEEPTAFYKWFFLSGFAVLLELILLYSGKPYFGEWNMLWRKDNNEK